MLDNKVLDKIHEIVEKLSEGMQRILCAHPPTPTVDGGIGCGVCETWWPCGQVAPVVIPLLKAGEISNPVLYLATDCDLGSETQRKEANDALDQLYHAGYYVHTSGSELDDIKAKLRAMLACDGVLTYKMSDPTKHAPELVTAGLCGMKVQEPEGWLQDA